MQRCITVCNAVRNNNGHGPDKFLVDFETAAINAIGNVLPKTEISGCFFHLSLNLWKHIQHTTLQERLERSQHTGLPLRMIAALAFMPPQDMVNSFDELCVVIRDQYDGDPDEVLDYFGDTYIGGFRRNASLFPIELWNMFNRTAEELPRTNNNIEACRA